MAKSKKTKKALIDINKSNLDADEKLLVETLDNDEGHFIDTKYYPINLILNGDLFKGLNKGQFYMFGGKPSTGKSYVAELIAHQIHDDYKDSRIKWFDIENAFGDGYGDDRDITNKGFSTERFELMKLPKDSLGWSVEQFGVICDSMLDDIIDEQTNKQNDDYNPDRVNLVVLDSLNSLPINKENKDVKKVDAGQDMGQKSKIIQRVFKPLIQKAYKSKTIFIIVNQVYEAPSLFPGQLPKFSGGNFTQFMASRMILFMTYANKNEDKEQRNRKHSGNRLCLLAFKNRAIIQGTFINSLLDYNLGLHRFYDICSLIPKVYEPLTDKNTRYMFHEWKLYDELEQKDLIRQKLELYELKTTFNFEIQKKLDTIVEDGKTITYFAISTEQNEDIIKNKKFVLVDTSEDVIDKKFIKSDKKYSKVVASEKISIIRFSDEFNETLNDINLVYTHEFRDSSYCPEDEFQELEWYYYTINSSKTKAKAIGNFRYIAEPKTKTESTSMKLEKFDKDYIETKEFKDLGEDAIVVRICSRDIKTETLYKKNGTQHFNMALLKKLNPYFNDALLYKNNKKDFKMVDEVDILELI